MLFAVVQDDSAVEAGSQELPLAFETAEIAFTDRACGFHLYADEARAALHDNVAS